jgi:hypothetical protein
MKRFVLGLDRVQSTLLPGCLAVGDIGGLYRAAVDDGSDRQGRQHCANLQHGLTSSKVSSWGPRLIADKARSV